MLNNTAKTGNFLVYIGNIYDVDKRFFDINKKSKYIPLIILAGLRQETTIRPTCFSFHSIGRADCAIVHFLTNATCRVFQSDHEKSEV